MSFEACILSDVDGFLNGVFGADCLDEKLDFNGDSNREAFSS